MIATYQRISRADGDLGKDGKDKSNSIENQKELIQRYISHKESLQNLPVMDFVDDGYTGSNFDRPGFQKMMDGVRSGEIDTIIVKDLSRFGRDYIGVGEYMEQIFPLDNYKNKKQEYDRKIAEVQDKIEQSKAEEAAQSVVPGTVRAAAEQAENFLHGTRLTASMVSAFIENVYVHGGGRIVVQFKYEQSIQDAVRALHTD